MKVNLLSAFLLLLLFIVISWLLFHLHLNKSSQIFQKEKIIQVKSSAIESAIQVATVKLKQARDISSRIPLKVQNIEELPTKSFSHPNTPVITHEKTSDPKHPKLHAVTYASHHGRDDRFCRSVESAIRYNYELVILGWQVPWRGLSQKLEAARKYAASIPENDLLLFTDAFDVLYTSDALNIVEIFLKRNYTILFAAECGCWPHVMDEPRVCQTGYPLSPTPYRYLNSGTWIGYAKNAKIMLEEVIQLAGNNFGNANDQKLVADMFISGKHGIQLDYYCEIFQSMHRTDPPPLASCNPYQDLELSFEKKWKNKRTNTFPAIFHFNGGGKIHHLPMEGKVWYKESKYNQPQQLEALRHSRITVPSQPQETLSFSDICSDYLQHVHR
jgi:hypothetical protein